MTDEPRQLGDIAASAARHLREMPVGEDLEAVRSARKADEDWARRIPKRFRGAQLTDVDEPAASIMFEWASKAPGPSTNVLLLGPIGSGKTHAAVGALRVCAEHGMSYMFAPIVEALDWLRPGGPPDTAARMGSVRVLLLDDLGAEKPSDWTAERLYGIVNRRWLNELATIVTTNIPTAELERAVDPRLFSRLVHNADAVQIGGRDRRRP